MKWGEYEIDNTALPATVVDRLLNSAFGHIMSNEASSHVVGKIREVLKPKDGKAGDVKTEQIQAFRKDEVNEKTIAGWEDAFRTAKIAAIKDGTLAVRVARAPTRDPVEAAMRAIAKLEVTAILKTNGLAFPGRKDGVEQTVDLGGQELSGDDLIDRRLGHAEHGPRIRTAAERKVREEQRLKDNAAKAAVGDGGLQGLL